MVTSDKFERYAVIVTVAGTLLLTVLGVSRHFGYGAAAARGVVTTPTKVPDWPRVVDGGHRLGNAAAKVTIVEFADFQCPACQQFARVVKPIMQQFGNDVAFVYRHFPLDYHQLAMPLAVAAECASEQGRFWAFHDLVFAEPDSMTVKSIESFARDAGVADMTKFATCRASNKREAITRDMEEARRIGLTGTPTLVVNGMKLAANDSASIVAEVRNALARR